jgi:CheY-like chemotaxis protein
MMELEPWQQRLILLVEDREDDIILFKRALQVARVPNPLFAVRDGATAARYLAGVGAFAKESEFPLPGLLVLDLKMPGMDGFELLCWVREQPGLQCLRTVILTSSDDGHDVFEASQIGANAFLVKPSDFSGYVDLARVLGDHWLRDSCSPQVARPPKGTWREEIGGV